MNTYGFTIYFTGDDDISDSTCNAIYDAGAHDATLARINGRVQIAFDREANTFADAVFSAMRDLKKVTGLQITGIQADRETDSHDAELINRTLELHSV